MKLSSIKMLNSSQISHFFSLIIILRFIFVRFFLDPQNGITRGLSYTAVVRNCAMVVRRSRLLLEGLFVVYVAVYESLILRSMRCMPPSRRRHRRAAATAQSDCSALAARRRTMFGNGSKRSQTLDGIPDSRWHS